MPDVFISYKREERLRVEQLAAVLEQLKLDVWFDAELHPGAAFFASINDALVASRAVIVCWTPAATQSPYVLGEAEHGRVHNKLVATFFQACALPPPFNMVHAEDLSAWTGAPNERSAGWRKVVGQIGLLTKRPGLLEFIDRASAGDAAALRRWASDNWKDPLTTRAVELARELESAPHAQGSQVPAPQGRAVPEAMRRLGARAVAAWEMDDSGQALINLGADYREGFGAPKDVDAARTLYEAGAEKGAPAGWHNLGLLYLQGLGVVQDYSTARLYFERAASAGNSAAIVNLGFMYDNGVGAPRDYAKARAHYERAAAMGEASAVANLAVMYGSGRGVRQDWDEARRLFERAAQMGNVSALDNLGTIYARGFGVAPNPALARQCYEGAAAQGDVSAIYNLGVFHLEGAGGAQDFEFAFACFEKAAHLDHAGATANLATMYAKGVGIWPDADRAATLYERAATLGATRALVNLAALLAERAQPNDLARARAHLRDACERGDELACVRLAEMTAGGEGGPRDPRGARTMLDRVARQSADPEAGNAARAALNRLR